MKTLISAACALACCASAQAAITTLEYSYNASLLNGSSNATQTGALGFFNSSLGTLTGAKLTLINSGSGTTFGFNPSPFTTYVQASASFSYDWSSGNTGLSTLLSSTTDVAFTAIGYAYMLGYTGGAVQVGGQGSTTIDLMSALSSLVGTGTFGMTCAGFTSINNNPSYSCGARLVYTYDNTPTASVPEPTTPALVMAALAGVVCARRRSNRKA